MVELMIQLIVIMIGKQAINGFIELAYPMVCYWFRRWRLSQPETEQQKIERSKKEKENSPDSNVCLCEKDYALNPVSQQFLFDEYLEMVIQLGFCTLFVAAFPLAPLLALINNIFEIRFDAYKFIVTMRRPVPAQSRNIGVWLTIINMLSNIAVLCNAFVIAFTSDFIPKIYYRMTQGTLHGYVNETLSYFDSSKLEFEKSGYPTQNYCRYWDLRRPPCSLEKYNFTFDVPCAENYEFTDSWWIILAFRLAFVLVFEVKFCFLVLVSRTV
uniref:Anoctamin n=1 Tax=Meloidogyne incognita TaxID=6306 RepID=A0A914LS54_MELIC